MSTRPWCWSWLLWLLSWYRSWSKLCSHCTAVVTIYGVMSIGYLSVSVATLSRSHLYLQVLVFVFLYFCICSLESWQDWQAGRPFQRSYWNWIRRDLSYLRTGTCTFNATFNNTLDSCTFNVTFRYLYFEFITQLNCCLNYKYRRLTHAQISVLYHWI